MINLQMYHSHIFQQIKHVLSLLSDDNYAYPMPVLQNASVGQHIRHIINFYEQIFHNINTADKIICYDTRVRDEEVEKNKTLAIDRIINIQKNIEQYSQDFPVTVYNKVLDLSATSSLYRELMFAMEHTIHHLAIIKHCLITLNISLPDDFGVAPSTIQHIKTCAQ